MECGLFDYAGAASHFHPNRFNRPEPGRQNRRPGSGNISVSFFDCDKMQNSCFISNIIDFG